MVPHPPTKRVAHGPNRRKENSLMHLMPLWWIIMAA